jgi:hypothetical protein
MTLWTLVKIAWSYSLTPPYVFMPLSLITRTDNFLRRNELCIEKFINPLNAELNPICYFLALLGAHHFLHVSRIRVKGV